MRLIIFLKIKKNGRTKTKVFLDCNGHKLFRTVEKTLKKSNRLVTVKLQNKKIQTDFAYFPRPGENDPYMFNKNSFGSTKPTGISLNGNI